MQRSMRFAARLLPIAVLTASLAGASKRRQEPAASDAAPQLKTHGATSDRSIVLDVVQRHVAGSVGDARTFTLLDNGKRVPAAAVHEAPGSESAARTRQLLFVLDALNCSYAEITRSEEALEAFLSASHDTLPEPASILIVSDSDPHGKAGTAPNAVATTALHARQLFVHRVPPTTDRAVLLHALQEYKPGFQRILEAQAGAGQGERVRLSLEALSFVATAQQAVPGAKLVIWISPGWPYLASSSAPSSEQLFDSIVYFSDLLRSARMILYAVDPGGLTASQFPEMSFAGPLNRSNPANIAPPKVQSRAGDTFYENFVKGASGARDANPNDLALQVLARQSGGLVLQHDNDLKALLGRCAADAASLTTLSYTPQPGDGVSRYHELSLTMLGGSGPVRTRAGFYLR